MLNDMFPHETKAYQKIVVYVDIGKNKHGFSQTYRLCSIQEMGDNCVPSAEKICEFDKGSFMVSHSWKGSGGQSKAKTLGEVGRIVKELREHFMAEVKAEPEKYDVVRNGDANS